MSTKEQIQRQCDDCQRFTKRGTLVTRQPHGQPGVRVAVWVCVLCQRNDQEMNAALVALSRRTLGRWKRF